MARTNRRTRSPAAPRRASEPLRPQPPKAAAAAAADAAGAPRLARWLESLLAPVDVASLAVFRVAFGVLMFVHIRSYLVKGWLETHYVSPVMYFSYPGFGWLPAIPKTMLPGLFWVLAGLAVAIALGIASRAACLLFALLFGYVLLLDTASYQNHLYLICLLAFLLAVAPVHHTLSLATRPGRRRSQMPRWALDLLRFQIAVPYVLGGIAKLNYDWLVRAQPVALWMADKPERAFRAEFLTERWSAYAIAWGGTLYDLLVVPALLWRRTRWLAVGGTILFHLSNWQLFWIGIFPWLMIAATTIFLPPDWPRRVPGLRRLLGLASAGGPTPGPARRRQARSGQPSRQPAVLAFLAVWVAFQCLLPFRHLLYPGAVDWTEEGHRFAWRMKLRDKRGTSEFFAVNKRTGERNPLRGAEAMLTSVQRHMMLHDPDMMRQFARFVAAGLEGTGYDPIEVRAVTSISLNGRPPQPLVDPDTDLAAQPRRWGPAPWIVPLEPRSGPSDASASPRASTGG